MTLRSRLLASSTVAGLHSPIQFTGNEQLCGECQRKNPHLLRAPPQITTPPPEAYCPLCGADIYAPEIRDGVVFLG